MTKTDFPFAFASDNNAGVHPAIMAAIAKVNIGHCPSYGDDDITRKLQDRIKLEFGRSAQSFLVFNGTAANVICLQTGIKSFESVACTDVSHLNVDECGAPEKHTGAKLIPIPHQSGKLTIEGLKQLTLRRGDQHFSQLRMVSITQPTELGTVYTLEEIRDIRKFCDQQGLYLHMDGARFANALVTTSSTFAQMTTDCGVDLLSLGGTKNGLMLGELIVVLNSDLAKNLHFLRKQSLQLASKSRYLSAQFLAYLGDPDYQNLATSAVKSGSPLWHQISTDVTQKAQCLAQGLRQIPGVEVLYSVESNAVFVRAPRECLKKVRRKFFFYIWDEQESVARLMTSWDTPTSSIDELVVAFRDSLGV